MGSAAPHAFANGRRPLFLLLACAAGANALQMPAQPRPSTQQSLLQQDLDRAVEARAAKERSLLQVGETLLALKQKGTRSAATGAGFGGMASSSSGGSSSKKKNKAAASSKKKLSTTAKAAKSTAGSELAKELRRSGVVRIDGGLKPETADMLREFVDAERISATSEVEAGVRKPEERFANLVLLSNRCDLLLPLHGPVVAALEELLGAGSVLGELLEEVVGPDAVFNEVACLISEPGSKQQPIHPDTPYTPRPPLFAAFVALQDVDAEMGPTVYLPGTHTKDEHTAFYGGDLARGRDTVGTRTTPIQEDYLASKNVKLGLLKKGDVALYNQQVLHCGSANESTDRVRRQFYISVRDPTVKGVAARPSIRPALRGKLTLGQVRGELRERRGLFEELDAADAKVVAISDESS